MELLERIGVEHPVVQAGMGGGIAGADLAGAVSAAGGLGTVGLLGPGALRDELRRAGEIAGGRPVAANLLVPFTRRAHVEACAEGGAAVVVLFFGFDRRLVEGLRERGMLVVHQVGTVDGVKRALDEGADGVIAQGVEAGGHLHGTERLESFLPRALAAAGGRPVLAAGGIARRADVERVLAAGAAAAVAGSRFLLTDESRAHPEYKRRALGATRTIDTKLFGFGWPDRHRVLPNAATERWERHARLTGALTAPTRALGRVLPVAGAMKMMSLQAAWLPLFGPAAPLEGMPDRLIEVTPLYAGESVRAIRAVVPAAEATRELAGAAPRRRAAPGGAARGRM
ncbi:MAG TPA: nitronate monooxygenase [Solirubrobacteraceae bacterium]|jgi:NAD(P)H-dependent flavin oxidoreductase YrpB (nitropropane dioxygenase family)